MHASTRDEPESQPREHRTMPSNTITFEQFVKRVDTFLFKIVGITTSDLVDINIRDFYVDGAEDDEYLYDDIRDAALHALEMSGAPMEVMELVNDRRF